VWERSDLSYRGLTGAMPTEIGEARNLIVLCVPARQLHSRSDDYCEREGRPFVRLTVVGQERREVQGNNLTGTLPTELAKIVRIKYMCVHQTSVQVCVASSRFAVANVKKRCARVVHTETSV
jgi:hypothetical protein